MTRTAGEIRQGFSDAFNWETHVQRYPGACLLVAGGVGWAIGNKLADPQEAGNGTMTGLRTHQQLSEPSTITRMAEMVASSVFVHAFPLLAEKMKQFFRGTSTP